MHAIVARQAGGPEVLELAEVERPVPGPGQLLVKVAAAGVNFIDTYKRSGMYKVPYPVHPGLRGSRHGGGSWARASPAFSVGDRVATAEGTNCYAGYTLIDEDKALPVPRGVDDFTAAALPLQGITAHYLINSSFKVEPGHTVLLHAGAGGVGLLSSSCSRPGAPASSPPSPPTTRSSWPAKPAPTMCCATTASPPGSGN